MWNKIILIFVTLLCVVKAIEWHRHALFYAADKDALMKENELNRLKTIGVTALILRNVLSVAECFVETPNAENVIAAAHKNFKLLIQLHFNCLTVGLREAEDNDTDSNLHFLTVLRHFSSKEIAGFVVNADDDRHMIRKFLTEYRKILSENRADNIKDHKKLILSEGSNKELSSTDLFDIVFLINDIKKIESNVGWKLEKYDESSPESSLNFVKLLLPGSVVIDESFNLQTHKTFLELRNHETMKHGNVSITNIDNDNVISITREYEDHKSFIIVVNLKSEKVNINLEKTDSDHRRVVTTSSLSSAYQEGHLLDSPQLTLQQHEVIVFVKETCNYCEDSKKNRFLAFCIFGSLLSIGVVYIIMQRFHNFLIYREELRFRENQ